MASDKSKLSVRNLSVHYFETNGRVTRAVNRVGFKIEETESMGIAGESACGKSTLGSALMRNLQPPGRIVSGSVLLEGTDIVRLEDAQFDRRIRWKKIAMVFQGAMNTLDPVFTVHDQMEEILRSHGIKGDHRNRILVSLEDVGLDSTTATKYPHELSGGMKQRVVIAMALLLDPDILIADEPTTALDVLVQSQIIGLLKKLQKEKGVSIILITHDLALVSQITDKIAIMYAGQLVEVSSTSDIYNNPRHPYTQALIKAIPKLRTEDKEIHFVKGSPPPLLNPPRGCRFYDRCIHAMDICKRNPLEFETETGYVRCWLHDGSGENPQP